MSSNLGSLKPAKGATHKGAPLFLREDVIDEVAKMTNAGVPPLRNETTAEDIASLKSAVSRIDEIREILEKSSERLSETNIRISKTAKDSGATIRDAADKLKQSFDKFQKTVSSSEIERNAESMAKLADALERINELEKSGALEKIGNMLKK